jgi:hypothetical protein
MASVRKALGTTGPAAQRFARRPSPPRPGRRAPVFGRSQSLSAIAEEGATELRQAVTLIRTSGWVTPAWRSARNLDKEQDAAG